MEQFDPDRTYLLINDQKNRRHIAILGRIFAKEYKKVNDTPMFDCLSLIKDLSDYLTYGQYPDSENIIHTLPGQFLKDSSYYPESFADAVLSMFADYNRALPKFQSCDATDSCRRKEKCLTCPYFLIKVSSRA